VTNAFFKIAGRNFEVETGLPPPRFDLWGAFLLHKSNGLNKPPHSNLLLRSLGSCCKIPFATLYPRCRILKKCVQCFQQTGSIKANRQRLPQTATELPGAYPCRLALRGEIMSICTNCGANTTQDMKFCASCGAPQLPAMADGADLQAGGGDTASQALQAGDTASQALQARDTASQALQQTTQPGDMQRQTPPQPASQEPTHSQPATPNSPRPTSQARENAVVGTFGWLGILILFAIPVVGFAMCIVWAFGGGNLNRRNFSRACLTLSVIAIVLSIVFAFVLGPLAWDYIKKSAKPYMEPYLEQIEQIKKAADGLPKPPTK